MNADEIVRKLAESNPWATQSHGTARINGKGVPYFSCNYCDAVRAFGAIGVTHEPSCLHRIAREYVANAPVASQEPQDSPIVARVSELLGETETDTPDYREHRHRVIPFDDGKCMDCGRQIVPSQMLNA